MDQLRAEEIGPTILIEADHPRLLAILLNEKKWSLDQFSISSQKLERVVFRKPRFDLFGNPHFAVLDTRGVEEILDAAAVRFDEFEHGVQFDD